MSKAENRCGNCVFFTPETVKQTDPDPLITLYGTRGTCDNSRLRIPLSTYERFTPEQALNRGNLLHEKALEGTVRAGNTCFSPKYPRCN